MMRQSMRIRPGTQTGTRGQAGTDRRRAAFTLIEVLVVISIIAVLMGLLLSAVVRVTVVKKRAETSARITAINNAMTSQKGGTSASASWTLSYVPPGRFDTSTNTWNAFRLRSSYPAPGSGVPQPDANSFEAQYISRVFGVRPDSTGAFTNLFGLDSSNKPVVVAADLDANQTLTFFLAGIPSPFPTSAPFSQALAFTGFSTNPQAPFTPRVTADEPRRGPVLDLGGSPKYAVDSTNGFARLIDAYGNPFVYFAPYNGLANKFYGGYNPLASSVVPYSTNGQFENPSGFQLISAGADGKFGITGNWASVDNFGQDDQANFAPNVLGAGK